MYYYLYVVTNLAWEKREGLELCLQGHLILRVYTELG